MSPEQPPGRDLAARSPDEPHGTTDVLRRTGITLRQLDYWIRQGLLGTHARHQPGSGGIRHFTPRDVVTFRILAVLTRFGYHGPRLAQAARTVNDWWTAYPHKTTIALTAEGHEWTPGNTATRLLVHLTDLDEN